MSIHRNFQSLTHAALLMSLAASCTSPGSSADAGRSADTGVLTTPVVASTTPLSAAAGVPTNASVTATFSEEMTAASLSATTFTLTSGTPAVAIPGTVSYAHSVAFFRPTALLRPRTSFTATITVGATSARGVALASSHTWAFTTGDSVGAILPVNLGQAGRYVILAKSAISTVPTSAVTGSVAISPAAASFITGFSLTADATTVFSTSPQVTGHVFAADYSAPTPSDLTTAVGDMELAFTDAAGRPASVTELGAGNIGGMTLAPGVYAWGTGLLIPTDVTLSGSGTDVWIFQIAQNLTMASGVRVVLAGGATSRNVFWQVAGAVEIGTTAHCEGVILGQTTIALRTGASINGRLLAQTAVSIESAAIVEPAH